MTYLAEITAIQVCTWPEPPEIRLIACRSPRPNQPDLVQLMCNFKSSTWVQIQNPFAIIIYEAQTWHEYERTQILYTRKKCLTQHAMETLPIWSLWASYHRPSVSKAEHPYHVSVKCLGIIDHHYQKQNIPSMSVPTCGNGEGNANNRAYKWLCIWCTR